MALVLVMVSGLWASPFIKSDPYATNDVQPTVFEMIMDANPSVDVSPTTSPTGMIFSYDLQTIVGSHSVQVRACVVDTDGTRYCSDYSPFAFTITPIPTPPKAPMGLRLQK